MLGVVVLVVAVEKKYNIRIKSVNMCCFYSSIEVLLDSDEEDIEDPS